MANFTCLCGEVIRLSGEGPSEYSLIHRSALFDLADKIDDNSLTYDEFSDTVIDKEKIVYLCPKCHRITIDDDNMMTIYSIERKPT